MKQIHFWFYNYSLFLLLGTLLITGCRYTDFTARDSVAPPPIQQPVCSATKRSPHYKEVNGRCLPSCEEKLKSYLSSPGFSLGRGDTCTNPLNTHTIEQRVPSNEYYSDGQGACCLTRCIELGITSIISGVNTDHSCGIMGEESYAQCWGDNQSGQIGNGCTPSGDDVRHINYVAKQGNTTCYANEEVPLGKRLTNIKQLALGKRHTCALLKGDTEITCWGWNDKGQLGNGKAERKFDSVKVDIPKVNDFPLEIESITAGDHHNCFLTKGNRNHGQVYCWGDNSKGQAGIGFVQKVKKGSGAGASGSIKLPEWSYDAIDQIESPELVRPSTIKPLPAPSSSPPVQQLTCGNSQVPYCVNLSSDRFPNHQPLCLDTCSGEGTDDNPCVQANGKRIKLTKVPQAGSITTLPPRATCAEDDRPTCSRDKAEPTCSNDRIEPSCQGEGQKPICTTSLGTGNAEAFCLQRCSETGTDENLCYEDGNEIKFPLEETPVIRREKFNLPQCKNGYMPVCNEQGYIRCTSIVRGNFVDELNSRLEVEKSGTCDLWYSNSGTKISLVCSKELDYFPSVPLSSVNAEDESAEESPKMQSLFTLNTGGKESDKQFWLRADYANGELPEVPPDFPCEQFYNPEIDGFENTKDGRILVGIYRRVFGTKCSNTGSTVTSTCKAEIQKYQDACKVQRDKWHKESDNLLEKEFIKRNFENQKIRFDSLAAGGNHNCGVSQDDKVYCWGDNSKRQLGQAYIEGSDNSNRCVTLPPPTPIEGIVACSDSVDCRLEAIDICDNCSRSPLEVKDSLASNENKKLPLQGVEEISVGADFTCAKLSDNDIYKVKCWGGVTDIDDVGGSREVIEDTIAAVPAPIPSEACYPFVRVPQTMAQCVEEEDINPAPDDAGVHIVDISDITAGRVHACVTRECNPTTDEVLCWGDNDKYQLSRNRNALRSSKVALPVLVTEVTESGTEKENTKRVVLTNPRPHSLVANKDLTCVTQGEDDSKAQITCWGSYFNPHASGAEESIIAPSQHPMQCRIPEQASSFLDSL